MEQQKILHYELSILLSYVWLVMGKMSVSCSDSAASESWHAAAAALPGSCPPPVSHGTGLLSGTGIFAHDHEVCCNGCPIQVDVHRKFFAVRLRILLCGNHEAERFS